MTPLIYEFTQFFRILPRKALEKNKDDEHIGEGEQRTEKTQQSNRSVSGRRVTDKACSCDTDRQRRTVNGKKVSRHGGKPLMMGYKAFLQQILDVDID